MNFTSRRRHVPSRSLTIEQITVRLMEAVRWDYCCDRQIALDHSGFSRKS